MPVYRYKGVAAGNRAVAASIDADSLRSARAKLRADGIFPTEILEGKTRGHEASELLAKLQLPSLLRVPDLALAMFSSQLATLIQAGLPLVQALSALTEQVERERFKAIIGRVREGVNEGMSLAEALGQFPQVFDELYRSMVRAGESSGALAPVLQRLAEYVENRMTLRNQLINAMIYPVLMLVFSSGVAGVLLVKVIPNITSMLKDMKQELPLATRVVIAISNVVTHYWLPALIAIGLAVVVWSRVIATESGKMRWDAFKLRLPVFGRLIRYVAIARFARTLATLSAGGVPIVPALEISKTVAANAVIGRAIDDARDAITRGSSIAGTMKTSGQFPPLVTHMISVGEASGELPSMLGKLADTYDDQVENALQRLLALLGPVLLIFVALVILTIILSTLMPLMNMTSALH
ncbi:MAG TPA: type II secretion system inner membrane protein GspF [Myxococcota bacterium]|nr:type II secretion system inner membrane protein GspF [Myxococcota bacterium]